MFELKKEIIIIGPNPSVSYRNGGVAKYIEYHQKIKCKELNFRYLYLDYTGSIFAKTPNVILKLLGLFNLLINLMFVNKGGVMCVHLQSSLYNKGGIKNFLIISICKLRSIPVLLHIHGGRYSKLNGISKFIWKLIFRLTEYIGVFPGPQFDELKEKSCNSKLIPMANFIPSQPLHNTMGIECPPPHFLFLGRIVKEKGIYLVWENFTKLKHKIKNAKLTIAGNGPDIQSLIKLHDKSPYHKDIKITGYVGGIELDEILKSCNIFLLPSFHDEGFPLSFLECSMVGMTSLITTNNAIPFYFKENKEYLPLDLKTNNIYNQMVLVAQNHILRKTIGIKARNKVVNNFTIESYARTLISIYKKVGLKSKQ